MGGGDGRGGGIRCKAARRKVAVRGGSGREIRWWVSGGGAGRPRPGGASRVGSGRSNPRWWARRLAMKTE